MYFLFILAPLPDREMWGIFLGGLGARTIAPLQPLDQQSAQEGTLNSGQDKRACIAFYNMTN
jgi:hypothetical protein